MSTSTMPGGGRASFGLLSRERTIAGLGFSRWMVPPAALCVHLCIGQAYAFSVFNLPMTRLIGITQSAPRRLEAHRPRLDLQHRHLLPGRVCCHVWPLGRGRRTAQGDVHRRPVLGGWIPALRGRRVYAQHLGRLPGLRRAWRLRTWHRLHLAGLHPDQMVPRSSWHGDRYGHHGLRWRCLHRLAAVGMADAPVFDQHACGCSRDLHRARHRLSLLHDGWRDDRPAAATRLGAGGIRRADGIQQADHHAPCVRLSGAEDAAVLVDLVGAVPERDCGNRRAGSGVGDEPGDVPRQGNRHRGRGLRRPDEPVQYGRPLLLGIGIGLTLAARAPISCSSCWASCSMRRCPTPARQAASACSCCASASSSACMAAASRPCPPICATCSARAMSARSMACLLTAWSMAGIFGPVLVNYIRQYNVEHGVAKAEAYNVTMYVMAALLIVGFVCNLFIKAVGRAPLHVARGSRRHGHVRLRSGRWQQTRITARRRCTLRWRGASSASRWPGVWFRPC